MPSRGSEWYSTWRTDHYKVDLDGVMEVWKAQNRRESIESCPNFGIGISGLEVMPLNQPVLDSPNPWSSHSDEAMIIDSPTSVISYTTTDSSRIPEVSSLNTSPTTLSSTSISPTSVAPSTPATSVVSCRACSLEFAGSAQDARSNFNRHLKTVRRHNKNAGLACPMSDCRRKPPMRSDNLGPHLLKIHKITSPVERKAITDECKRLAREAKVDGTTRRRSRRD